MKRLFFLLSSCASLLALSSQQLEAKCLGKVEVAPAFVHIDVIESKNTIRRLDMPGVRLDLSYVTEKGWLVKPTLLYARESGGELITTGVGFGRCIPYKECWVFNPTVGINYTNLGTSVYIDLGAPIKFRERFEGHAPYAGLEVIYKISPRSRIGATFQYAWSRSKTHVKSAVAKLKTKDDAEGASYALMYEYDLNQCWSVNIGGAYNESYGKDKSGIRAHGGKVGLVRWF